MVHWKYFKGDELVNILTEVFYHVSTVLFQRQLKRSGMFRDSA